jgi:hypothetical protein
MEWNRRRIGIVLVATGMAIAIPSIDDLVFNLPLGWLASNQTGVPMRYTYPLTYLLGLPLIAIGLLLVTKRYRDRLLGRD